MRTRHTITICSQIGLPSLDFRAIWHPSHWEISKRQARRIPKDGGYRMVAHDRYAGDKLPVIVY